MKFTEINLKKNKSAKIKLAGATQILFSSSGHAEVKIQDKSNKHIATLFLKPNSNEYFPAWYAAYSVKITNTDFVERKVYVTQFAG